ncbi:hypothetical protein OB953_13270 [Aeromonas salmonicida]|uniref:hypothetical protein n=1 Tax=Aeromonas salmonicida TaxID=645 RepID=UPI00259DEA8F|nr:hypothetical protein [Aeromonas salmonicida]MDM5136556.1 hypothetical protein [Aeromonas salmonicida]
MNYRLISIMERDLGWWWEDLRGASARLQGYQRLLIECRHLSPRPRATIALTLRQCAAARRICAHSSFVIKGHCCALNSLLGTTAQ